MLCEPLNATLIQDYSLESYCQEMSLHVEYYKKTSVPFGYPKSLEQKRTKRRDIHPFRSRFW